MTRGGGLNPKFEILGNFEIPRGKRTGRTAELLDSRHAHVIRRC
jgi:hypothetical protein